MLSRWTGRLKVTGVAAAIVTGLVLLAIWGWMLHEVKAPFSSTDPAKSSARPTSAECSSLIGVLTGPSGPEPRITPEIREKFRQCFQRR